MARGDLDEADDGRSREHPLEYDPLSPLQRWLAGLVGVGGVGAGSAAVFLSANQAGSSTLLIVSSVFLLISVQGTPIRRATKDSVDFGGIRAAKKVREALEKAGPEAASNVLENYREVLPNLNSSPAFEDVALEIADARSYEERARAAVIRSLPAGWSAEKSPEHGRTRWDLVITDPASGRSVAVEFKFRSSPRPDRTRAYWLSITEQIKAARDVLSPGEARQPVFVVTNVSIPHDHEYNITFARWRDERDDEDLWESLQRFASLL